MPLNTNLLRPPAAIEFPDQINRLAQFSQIQNAQNQNALAQYTLAAAQRGENVKSALDRAYLKAYNPQTGQIDPSRLRGAVIESQIGSELPAIEKSIAEVEKAQLARKKEFGEVVNQKLAQSKGLLANVDSNEGFLAWYDANNADPVLGEYFKSRGMNNQQARAALSAQLAQPGGLQRLIAISASSLDKLPETLENQQAQAVLGGRTPTQPMTAPTTAMVAPIQTAAVPAPAVTAMPAVSGLQSELSAVNNEIARLQSSGSAGLGAVQKRIGELEQQKARLFTAINQERQADTSALQAQTSAKQANIASYKLTSTKNGVVKTNVLTGESEFVLGPDGKPMTDIVAAQAAETARSNAEREKADRARLGLEGQRVALQGQANARAAEQIPLQQAFDTDTKSLVFVDRADIRANPNRYKPVNAEEKLRNIPETINKGLTGNVASISQIDRAIDAVTKNPSSVGIKGNFPQAILNRADPQGVETRALITDVGSAKVHDRSGAAVAASEAPRLMPFIPQATDDAETVVKKLKQLKTQIETEQSGILDFYSQEQGYKPSLYHKKQDVPTEPAAPAAAKPAAADIGSLPPKVTKDGATYVLQPNGKYIKQ